MGDDAPGGAMFEGASKVVHPALAEGCIDFAARAIKELFPADGPVKTKIFGKSDTAKLDKAKKKRDYLNFLLTKKMPSYRDEKEILLTQLPLGGSQYEKFYVTDTERGEYAMEFVPIDKALLPFSASSFYSTPRFTHLLDLTRAEFEKRIEDGFYKDIRLINESMPEESAAQKANDKIEGKEADNYNVDGLRRVYEIKLSAHEIDEEIGPYIVHLDESTSKIVAIYRNWAEDDESKAELEWWAEDKFIPWRGAYGIGLPNLIGGLAAAMTGALRALLDAAHINNSPGAVKLKGGRASGQNITIEQTQIAEMEAPPGVDDIRKVMMPLPFNPPSMVLFQLLEWMTNQAKGVVATAEERIADASNQMPVGTALALIEQGSQVFSSIHGRLHETQRRSLQIICRLVHTYPNMEDLQRFGLSPEDFADNDDIDPVSDPRIFSEAQRYAQLQESLKIPQMFPEQPWNRNAMARRALELLRVDFVNEWLPSPPQPVTADPVTENFAAVTEGAPLKAAAEQDHVAHLRGHLAFIMSPLFGAGPLPGQALQGILQHCTEHLMLVYQLTAQELAAQTGEQSELGVAEASEFAMEQLTKQLDHLGPMLQQATQMVQSKMPQPPVDPAVQKTFEAAMAEIERKKALDQETVKLKQSESAQSATLQQQQQAIDERLAQMDAELRVHITGLQEQGKRESEQLRQQIEMMKNDRDNETHQITELLKNRDDNQTAVLIEQMKQMVSEAIPQQSVAPRQDDGMLQEMQRMLGEIEKAKTGDALTATIDALRQMMASQQGHQERTMALAQQLLQSE